MSTPAEREPITVDVNRYAEQVARQRNTALDENAQLRAVVEELVAERDQARAELATLKQ